ETPPLLNSTRDGFAPALCDSPAEAGRRKVTLERLEGPWLDPDYRKQAVRAGVADAILAIPKDLRQRLATIESEQLPIHYDSTDERSQITYLRLKEVLGRWKGEVVTGRREHDRLPPSYTDPFQIQSEDAASASEQGVNVWAKLFPFLLVMMSLTGAFYPAIDLCAGEKERGTMETLLISPASRAEIVLGKFFTVVLASMMSALLNIVSMGLTGVQLARQVGALKAADPGRLSATLSPPSLTAAFWMILLLIPLAVFFSAVCLSLAVLARSMKEGQYYMTPLYIVCLPLIFLTLAPGIELNLFYSLVPITGVSLLLRALILGDYELAWRFFLPVLIPTVVYGAVALRWAIDQFQREEVLFREAERFDLRIWVRHLLRDKEPTPTGGEALFCFALMLTLAWFLIQFMTNNGLASSPATMAAGQVAFILTPPLAMAVLLTSAPRRTLRLYWPKPRYLALGIALPLALNPLVNELRPIVERLFPISQSVKDALSQMMTSMPSLGMAILLFAAIPAVCEELAFRGFILTGLERGHRTRSAILLSALLFGFLHVLLSLFQQLFNATLLGLVLGLLAVRSGSVLPGILFHFINNALAVTLGTLAADPAHRRLAEWLYRRPADGLYHWWWVALGTLASALLLAWLWRSGGRAPSPKKKHEVPDLLADLA
ncbi:MAG: sodium transport system permease protein, partial [Chloroflexota bacterium]|nr:sodium transport system permease protein [Chloroflexota bacterium]